MGSLTNKQWFAAGGRHGLANRTADLGPLLDQFDSSTMSALDAGAAEGDISFWLSERFHQVTAVELMDEAFGVLAARTQDRANVRAVKADIFTFDIPDPFDCVFLLGVLHYFPEDADKRTLLLKYLEGARYAVFARTGVREFRMRDGLVTKDAARYTPQSVIEECAQTVGADFGIVDNSYRGRGEHRLGDLIVFRLRRSGNPVPEMATLISSAPSTLPVG